MQSIGIPIPDGKSQEEERGDKYQASLKPSKANAIRF